MCERAVKNISYILKYVSGQYKTREVCDKVFQALPWSLSYSSDQYKT